MGRAIKYKSQLPPFLSERGLPQKPSTYGGVSGIGIPPPQLIKTVLPCPPYLTLMFHVHSDLEYKNPNDFDENSIVAKAALPGVCFFT